MPSKSPFAILRTPPPRSHETEERQLVTEVLGHCIYDLLVQKSEIKAIRLLRQLRSKIREGEAIREYLELSPKGSAGRPAKALAKRTMQASWSVYVAIELCGLSKADVIRTAREEDRTWIIPSHDYDWVKQCLDFVNQDNKDVLRDLARATCRRDLHGLSANDRKAYGRDLVRGIRTRKALDT